MDRLVLGAGAAGTPLLERLAERPSSLIVLVEDDRQAESLREEGIDARPVSLTDHRAVRTVAGPVDTVVVAPAERGRGHALADCASRAYPDAFVLGCIGTPVAEADRAAVGEHADRVVDAGRETTRDVLKRAGEAGSRTRRLQRTLREIDGTLGVFAHDDPDPDAIASAVCLCRIAERAGTDAEVCYYGAIDHQENRALVNLLSYELRNLEPDHEPSEFDGFALVDHSRPGINSGLPESTPIDVVIDHHPPRAPVEARFVDLRSEVGATCTLLTDHLRQLDVAPGTDVATGLLYGLRTDTNDFSRQVSTEDFEAAVTLVEYADHSALQRIESPSLSGETMDVLADAVRNRRVEGEVVTSCVEALSDRDALAQSADRLLELEVVSTTLVFGFTDDVVHLSARSRAADVDLGEVLREAFGRIGSAGGHADMAGAQIPAGMLVEDADESERGAVIEEVVTDRFFEALGTGVRGPRSFGYDRFPGTDDPGAGQ
jgi:nanoRNase/pAp phosphatase (c-di-AMP/oligoRNAs hydrolase)